MTISATRIILSISVMILLLSYNETNSRTISGAITYATYSSLHALYASLSDFAVSSQ